LRDYPFSAINSLQVSFIVLVKIHSDLTLSLPWLVSAEFQQLIVRSAMVNRKIYDDGSLTEKILDIAQAYLELQRLRDKVRKA
jgi:hypothetical protein